MSSKARKSAKRTQQQRRNDGIALQQTNGRIQKGFSIAAAKNRTFLRELEIGLLNAERCRHVWRATKLLTELPDFTTNKVDTAWCAFERVLNAKNFRIACLSDALSESAAQSRRKGMAHVAEGIARTIDAQMDRLRMISGHFPTLHREQDSPESQAHNQEIARFQRINETLLSDIGRLLEDGHSIGINNARTNANSVINTFILDGQKERADAAVRYEERLGELSCQLQALLASYREGTEKRRFLYSILEEQDKRQGRVLELHSRATSVLFNQLDNLCHKLSILERANWNKSLEIRGECTFFRSFHCQALEQSSRSKNCAKRRVVLMSVSSERLRQHLEHVEDKLGRVLVLAALARKYESQQAKAAPLPWPGSEAALGGTSHRHLPALLCSFGSFEYLDPMTLVWQRLALVRASIRKLHNRISRLNSQYFKLRRFAEDATTATAFLRRAT